MPTRTIKAIFYTRFHPEKGSRVLYQVPSGSITPSHSPSALPIPLIPFASVTSYLIPTQQFCDRLLTFCVAHHRVIGYPVCIREGKYSRNEFMFNFALVVAESEKDWRAYGEVVRKLGRLLRGLEEQGGFLSREEEEDEKRRCEKSGKDDEEGVGGGGSKVYALCEMVLEDLNNYAECMIPIDDTNTINLKLFPTRPPPPPILAHQVPLLTISLSSLQSPISSDLTLNRILPFINGVHSVSRIAMLADTDLSLTRRAIQHLVYYGCLILIDIFSFGAIYAPTAEITSFVTDEELGEECRRYVRIPSWGALDPAEHPDDRRPSATSIASQSSSPPDLPSSTLRPSDFELPHHQSPTSPDAPQLQEPEHPTHLTLITLYTSLRQGLTLHAFVNTHLALLRGIDLRRLITFGVIKGFLYRVHKYAIAGAGAPGTNGGAGLSGTPGAGVGVGLGVGVSMQSVPPAVAGSTQSSVALSTAGGHTGSDAPTVRGQAPIVHSKSPRDRTAILTLSTSLPRSASNPAHPSLSHTQTLQNPNSVPRADTELNAADRALALSINRFLDGMHCFDEICSVVGVRESEVERVIKGDGGGVFYV